MVASRRFLNIVDNTGHSEKEPADVAKQISMLIKSRALTKDEETAEYMVKALMVYKQNTRVKWRQEKDATKYLHPIANRLIELIESPQTPIRLQSESVYLISTMLHCVEKKTVAKLTDRVIILFEKLLEISTQDENFDLTSILLVSRVLIGAGRSDFVISKMSRFRVFDHVDRVLWKQYTEFEDSPVPQDEDATPSNEHPPPVPEFVDDIIESDPEKDTPSVPEFVDISESDPESVTSNSSELTSGSISRNVSVTSRGSYTEHLFESTETVTRNDTGVQLEFPESPRSSRHPPSIRVTRASMCEPGTIFELNDALALLSSLMSHGITTAYTTITHARACLESVNEQIYPNITKLMDRRTQAGGRIESPIQICFFLSQSIVNELILHKDMLMALAINNSCRYSARAVTDLDNDDDKHDSSSSESPEEVDF